MKDVTILIPAYNEVKFIEQAIRSAVPQAEFVIVSDNCSTDGTQEICKRLAKEFSNLIFYTQSENIGSVKNSEFLYSLVKTDYVMTMGAHDYLAPNYIVELKKCLDANLDTVMAYPSFINIDEENHIIGCYNADELMYGLTSNDIFLRVVTLIEKLSNCSIFFGLCKTYAIKESLDFTPTAGIDIVILTNMAAKGRFIQCPNTQFFRRYLNRVNNHTEYLRRITNDTSVSYDFTYLCQQQYNSVQKIEDDDLIKKNYYLDLSKKNLHKRFARLCHQDLHKKLSKLKSSKENFILYGSGSGADQVISYMRDYIIGIVDKDPKKWNTEKDKFQIQDLTFMHTNKNFRILITVLGENIIDKLISYGIEYQRIVSLNILDAIE